MKHTVLVFALVVATFLIVACAAPTPETVVQTKVVEQTRIVEATKIVEKVVTATPPPTAAPKKGGTLIAARAIDATGLDPHKQTAFASFRMLELIYDPLFAFDKDLKIVPNLAEAWKFSEDAKTLTVTLRKNVKFHTGNPMTAEDVKFSFERILDEKTGAAARSTFAGIDKIETPDPYTIVFTLKTPNAALLSAMAHPNSAIIDKKAVTNGADPAKVGVGTGAFMIDRWDPDRTFTMKANKDFWLPGLPRLDAIEWRTIPDESSILAGLRAQTLDWAIIEDPRIAIRASAGPSALNLARTPGLGYYVLQLNTSRPPFNDVRVRQAIACAIDRQEVLDLASLGAGQVTGPATQPLYRANPDTLFCYKPDLAKAKQLLAEAKATNIKFKIMVAMNDPSPAVEQVQTIQTQLKKVGIETEIERLDIGTYIDRWYKTAFDATIPPYVGGNPDPDVMLYPYWHSTGSLNKIATYNNPDLDKLLDQGRAIADSEKRKPIYLEFQKKLTEAAPWIWLYVGYEYRVQQPFVKGFTPLPNRSLIYLREAWLDK